MAKAFAEFKIEVKQEDMDRVKKLVERIGAKGLSALSRAINKTMSGTTSGGSGKQATGGMIHMVSKILQESINLTATTLKNGPSSSGKVARKNRTFVIEKATPTSPTGTFTVQSANIPMIHYSNQRGQRATHAQSIYVQVRKDRKRVKLKHGFVPQLASGHKGVFNQVIVSTCKGGGQMEQSTSKRKKKNKYTPVRNANGNIKIRELYGPRISDIYSNKPILDDRVLPQADEKLTQNLNHEIDWLLQEEGKLSLND